MKINYCFDFFIKVISGPKHDSRVSDQNPRDINIVVIQITQKH